MRGFFLWFVFFVKIVIFLERIIQTSRLFFHLLTTESQNLPPHSIRAPRAPPKMDKMNILGCKMVRAVLLHRVFLSVSSSFFRKKDEIMKNCIKGTLIIRRNFGIFREIIRLSLIQCIKYL